jgi:hypothetical protein
MNIMCSSVFHAASILFFVRIARASLSLDSCGHDEDNILLRGHGASLLQHSTRPKLHGDPASNASTDTGAALPQTLSLISASSTYQHLKKAGAQSKPIAKPHQRSLEHVSKDARTMGSKSQEKTQSKKNMLKKTSSSIVSSVPTIPSWIYGGVFVIAMCGFLNKIDDAAYPNESQVSEKDPRHKRGVHG